MKQQNKSIMSKIHVTDREILDVATKVVTNMDEVHSLSTRLIDDVMDGIGQKFGKKSLPGLNLKHHKEGLEINLYCKVFYGYQLIDVSKHIQRNIRTKLKETLGLEDVKVDVHIEGLVTKQEEFHNE
ncbi:hypothetical protein HMPREF0872_02420 [Veillonella montpellierensis DNF00314]|uniref:Alkaline-shock protein n=1 Tax=Veillonella montpellierensis DNF00314 TaxID=1401067 RepID=A0A096CRK8_9FIRM|nr:Asp23/Gls24 family envelope stress response protein [Veillonella montpellierensis]KGF47964.1 hypothetical protein HMPREF0872_02420 [Veillonella montpellierensis DNF00314]